jgi:hypothetical protein
MVITLLFSLAAFSALFVWLLIVRMGMLRTGARLRDLARAIALAEAELGD